MVRVLTAWVLAAGVILTLLLLYRTHLKESSLNVEIVKTEAKFGGSIEKSTVKIIIGEPAEKPFSPMPDALQWWEKDKVLTSVAVVLASGENMRKLHAFLGERIASMKGCPDSFEEAVLYR